MELYEGRPTSPSECDSLHLTSEGHRILAEELCKMIKSIEK
ncbi:hypothetical protein QYZ88_007560 [Lachnospiraceae bacterium C1.1]|nr:hypothetical protein [Lachnospiraceae bacterium C1.1]